MMSGMLCVVCMAHASELYAGKWFCSKNCVERYKGLPQRKIRNIDAKERRKGGEPPVTAEKAAEASQPPAASPPKHCACCGSKTHKSQHHLTREEKFTDNQGREQVKVYCEKCKRVVGSHMAGKDIPPQQSLIDFFG